MPDGVADVAERLMAEFRGVVGPAVVSAAVCAAARDVSESGAGAWAELVERSARQRVLERL